MATVNLSFDVPAGHIATLRAFLDFRYGDAVDGMTDEQALEFHMVKSTVPGYQQWRRAHVGAVATAKATLETNEATRSSARQADGDALASAQAAAGAAASSGIVGLS
jgi:hypothetical protein